MDSLNMYRGYVTYVIEGDYYDVVLDLGFHIQTRVRMGLRDFSVPSIDSPTREQRVRGRSAKDVAMSTLLGRWVLVRTFRDTKSKSGWSASFYLDAETQTKAVIKQVWDGSVVDFAAYLAEIESNGVFDQRLVELSHDERSSRGYEAIQESSR